MKWVNASPVKDLGAGVAEHGLQAVRPLDLGKQFARTHDDFETRREEMERAEQEKAQVELDSRRRDPTPDRTDDTMTMLCDESYEDDDDETSPYDPDFLASGWSAHCLQDVEDIDFEFVYALHTFVATVEGQANATKGDTMVLLDDSNSYWWLVRVVKDSSIGELLRRL